MKNVKYSYYSNRPSVRGEPCPLSTWSTIITCVLPVLFYGCENWIAQFLLCDVQTTNFHHHPLQIGDSTSIEITDVIVIANDN